jgi:hypothetical protein
MKKQLIAFGLLALTTIFYFAVLGVLVGIVLTISEPIIINGVFLGVSMLVLVLYMLAFKLKPNFKKIVFLSLKNSGPMS